MKTNNESRKPEPEPKLPGKKGGGDGDAKGTDQASRRTPQPGQSTANETKPQPRDKSRKITSSRP
jgi:hypothetical protein